MLDRNQGSKHILSHGINGPFDENIDPPPSFSSPLASESKAAEQPQAENLPIELGTKNCMGNQLNITPEATNVMKLPAYMCFKDKMPKLQRSLNGGAKNCRISLQLSQSKKNAPVAAGPSEFVILTPATNGGKAISCLSYTKHVSLRGKVALICAEHHRMPEAKLSLSLAESCFTALDRRRVAPFQNFIVA